MTEVLKNLIKQPYWVITLILGVSLVASTCISLDKNHYWITHSPNTYILVVFGSALIVLSIVAFAASLILPIFLRRDDSGGLDLRRVRETDGYLWTRVDDCEIRIKYGRVEECVHTSEAVVVLPCNEYFDDECINDRRSALGAYINRIFEGQFSSFSSLIREECSRKLGMGTQQKKTEREDTQSFGPGRCLLLSQPLGRSTPIALVSTTTQRAGQGLASRISYLFDGMHELVKCLADARLNEVIMPILGAGHGRIDPPLALVGLLLAVAEAARYGQGGQHLRRVTIIVFKRDLETVAEVDKVVIRRALALVGS